MRRVLSFLALACVFTGQHSQVEAAQKKASVSEALPVFSFMDQSTEQPRTMTMLGGDECTISGATVSCLEIGGELAGQRMVLMTVGFYNERLYKVTGAAKRWAFPDILAAFTLKYGKPSMRSEKWQNRMGASLDNSIATWSFKGGKLELRAIGSSIDLTEFNFLHAGNSPPRAAAKVDF